MAAFASNSILTRMAIEPGHIDPISFALLRVLAGSVILALLIWSRGIEFPVLGRARMVGALSLSVYMIGFSMAYISLDAGLGALILFGVVQTSMFSYSVYIGVRPTTRQLAGALLAFVGLSLALWPDGEAQGSVSGTVYMTMAGLGWAAYTLSGKMAKNPLAETGANFAFCLPILAAFTFPFVERISTTGAVLAITCGAITSGLGYALWYKVLPDLQRSIAAVVQLSVPIIAILAGAILLGETVSVATLGAAALVIAGIGMAVTKQPVQEDRN